jgi:hypothetical protein
MIRRDYILRMIEQFIQALRRIQNLKQGQDWNQANLSLDEQFQVLLGAPAEGAVRLSETELLARLIGEGPTQVMREKLLMTTTLFKEAGDLALARGLKDHSRAYYLKGLHLLLDVLGRSDLEEMPEFVPKLEVFVAALRETLLPLQTNALLMQHYERTGEFAKAEDALFAMLDEENNPTIVEFGIGFYERLKGASDASLAEGHLPRTEVEAGLAQLRSKLAAPAA